MDNSTDGNLCASWQAILANFRAFFKIMTCQHYKRQMRSQLPAFEIVPRNKNNNKLAVIFSLLSPSQTSKIKFTDEVRQNSQLQTRMSRMFYRICESMYCSIVRVRVWTALCVFKTFVLPWQRLRKKFKSMWLSQLTNLISNLLKISKNSEKDTLYSSQPRPLTSSEDTKSKSKLISITTRNDLI